MNYYCKTCGGRLNGYTGGFVCYRCGQEYNIFLDAIEKQIEPMRKFGWLMALVNIYVGGFRA